MHNPHIALTLTVTKADGTQLTVVFVEGAAANMILRMGLSADIAVGKPIREWIGSGHLRRQLCERLAIPD